MPYAERSRSRTGDWLTRAVSWGRIVTIYQACVLTATLLIYRWFLNLLDMRSDCDSRPEWTLTHPWVKDCPRCSSSLPSVLQMNHNGAMPIAPWHRQTGSNCHPADSKSAAPPVVLCRYVKSNFVFLIFSNALFQNTQPFFPSPPPSILDNLSYYYILYIYIIIYI